MAAYSVRTAKHATLAASTADTVTLAAPVRAVAVVNRDGAGTIYFTINGAAPNVGGDDTYVLPATIGALELPVGGACVVQLISTGAPAYSVQAV